jgi:hypothetical protein
MASRLSGGFPGILAGAILIACGALAQEPFPAGTEGELYYCPRIDLNPVKDGGPLTVVLDGILDEPFWERVQFQKWSVRAGEMPTPDHSPPEEDLDLSWAAVADKDYLYVAWRVVDDARMASETFFCNVWQDDSVEVYLDALNDGPSCPTLAASCYGKDDAQLTIGADQVGKFDPIDPDLLEFGGVAGKGSCDFIQAAPELCKGVCQELDSPEGLTGWQAEIAIALDTLGNADDGTPEWHIDPRHGTTIGWNVHVNDDDNGTGRDHKVIWSKIETTETSWINPGAFGKLIFIAPDRPLAVVNRDVPDDLRNGGSGRVTLTASPKFGEGVIVIREEMPPGLVASAPSEGGTINGNAVTWDLGKVQSEKSVSYTLTVAADAADARFPGQATIDGEPFSIGGDAAYTGSPISADGFIKIWNHLGPLAGGGCDPGPDLSLDWIVNVEGTIDETNVFPFPGMITKPKYGGTGDLSDGTGARATGLLTLNGTLVEERIDVFPVWKAGHSPIDTIDHASSQVHGYNFDNQVTLSCVYVTNHTQSGIDTLLGMGSDDSIQVYLNEAPIWQSNICRDWGSQGQEQDLAPILLPPGESRILVKIADGTGSSGFRLRIQDPAGGGLLPPDISLSLESADHPPPARVVRSLGRDSFSLGDRIDVSLAVTAAPAVDVKVLELLPADATALAISDGGAVNGGAVVWNLKGVTAKTVTYQLQPGPCAGDLDLRNSSYAVAEIEALVGGPSKLRREVRDDDLGTWDSREIGVTGGAAQRIDDGTVVVSATGQGAKLNKDELRFISRPASGDFELTTRIECLDDPVGTATAGVMVRDTLDTFSASAFFYLTSTEPAGGGVGTLKASYRRGTNANFTTLLIPLTNAAVQALPIYLRLKRAGNTLTFQRSTDGAAFTDVGTKEIGTVSPQINLRADTLLGLAAASGGTGTARVTFAGLSGFATLPGKNFRRGDVDANGSLEITDAVAILSFLFQGGGTPPCLEAGDIDNNGETDITDAVNDLGYLFLGAPPPEAPGPLACGPDPAPPFLGCDKPCP